MSKEVPQSVHKSYTLEGRMGQKNKNKTWITVNQDLSISLERPYKELLNASFSFEIHHS